MGSKSNQSRTSVQPGHSRVAKPVLKMNELREIIASNMITWITTLCLGVRGDQPHRLVGHMGKPMYSLYSCLFDLTGTEKDALATFKGIFRPARNLKMWSLKRHFENVVCNTVSELGVMMRVAIATCSSAIFSRGIHAELPYQDFVVPQSAGEWLPYLETDVTNQVYLNHLNHDVICNVVMDILQAEQAEALSVKKEELSAKRHMHPATNGYQYGGFDFTGDTVSYHHGWTMKGAWILQVPGFWNYIKGKINSVPEIKSVNLKTFRKVTKYGAAPSRDVATNDVLVGEWPSSIGRFTGVRRPLMDLSNKFSSVNDWCWERRQASFADLSEACELVRMMALNFLDSMLEKMDLAHYRMRLATIILALPVIGCTVASDKENSPTRFGGVTSDLKSDRLTFVETQGDLSIQAKSEFGQKYSTPRLVKDASVLIPASTHSWTWARWRMVCPVGFTWNLWKLVQNLKLKTDNLDNQSWFSYLRRHLEVQLDEFGYSEVVKTPNEIPIPWNDFNTQVSTLRIVPSAIEAVVENLILDYTENVYPGLDKTPFSSPISSASGIEYFSRSAEIYMADHREGFRIGLPLFGFTPVRKAVKASGKPWDEEAIVHSFYKRHRIITKPRLSHLAKYSRDQDLKLFVMKKPKLRKRKNPNLGAWRRKGCEILDMKLAIESTNKPHDLMRGDFDE